ncbi:MAG: ketoacyl-ACP synthase III [Deltaproteobacteria bacterium]|nr:ketoacyl-ACP synthase III [Deltaproteobacteria bacterium]
MRSKIIATGRYIPERLVTNEDLSNMFDTSDEWIKDRTGIEQRYYIKDEMGASDMAFNACENVFNEGIVKREDIDFIIFATLSPDHTFPGSGCFLQGKLGLADVPSMDIRNQCTGFLYSLRMGDLLIKSGDYKRVLIAGAEVHSTGLDFSNNGRDVTVLFGDGAGVVVLGPCEDNEGGFLSFALHSDGTHAKDLWLDCPGSRYTPSRINKTMIDEGRHFPKMNGRRVFSHAVKKMPEVLMEALESSGTDLKELDLIVPHQANKRINEKFAEMLGISFGKVYSNIERYGNTTAASIPIALDELRRQGRLKKGDMIGLVAFGSGFTWAASIVKWV